MRITPVSNMRSYSFGAVKSATQGVSKEIFGKKEELYNLLSEEKGVDIWTFKRTKGGMVNPISSYIILIQNKKGSVVKEISGFSDEEKQINKRVEESLVWYNAQSNFYAANTIRQSNLHDQYLKDAQRLESKLLKSGLSAESSTWEHRFELI